MSSLCVKSSVAALLLAGLVVASPISSTIPSGPGVRHFKRSEAGPMLNGHNFPDPSLIQVDGTWYAFATAGSGVNIQVASSPDFDNWSLVTNSDGSQTDALPNVPAWVAQSPNTWAPDVHQYPNGQFVMTYSASAASSSAHHCIGVATSDSVTGPYTPSSDSPFVCDLSNGGDIDSSTFFDPSNSSQPYLLWKTDGNSLGDGPYCNQNANPPYYPTPINIQALTSDGLAFADGSSPTVLLNADQDNDGIVEAPSLVQGSDGYYYLFYSPGCFSSSLYSVSYAYATSVLGPYTRAPNSPLFYSGDNVSSGSLSGPGGATCFADGQHMVFHANNNGGRSLYTAIVTLSDGNVSA